MGRRQQFDTTDVVRRARDAFWDKGLDGTSVPDLEQATGLARSSIYHAFSSKRGLFDAAVQDYLDSVIRPRLRALVGPEAGPDAVLHYLRGLSESIAALPDASTRRGCLLLACAAGPDAHDPALRAVVHDYRIELGQAIAHALALRHPDPGPHTRDRRALVIASLVMSALLVARTDTDGAVATLAAAVAQVQEWDEA
jgi:AcrR family transcriptional regulator